MFTRKAKYYGVIRSNKVITMPIWATAYPFVYKELGKGKLEW